ncbi:ImmA/IrrE family metallo-endopeptidase [Rhodoblastus sp.]|jgi:Zn-dependent peptidase ImmA (M78 family)|uniref:ImmA/IrrE family metallo-endopeptidase n=1 Tax=Rhodoblastus sp. TaxID=1962975 RepID=UPI0025E96153|nr:ImmA/IrrE family metallo-endopeptidase [Rhodoblastus sp.]
MADEKKFGALRWAIEMTQFWKAAAPGSRFPVNVELIAETVSASRFPSDRIKAIKGGAIPDFDGALYPIDDPRNGWAIIYNKTDVSLERQRFTIAHEFGHYLAHRHLLPNGVECDEKVVTQRSGKGIEKEADEFAASLLMPFDDFKARIPADAKPSLDDLGAAAEHYGVSLTATALRWLEYTERRAVFMVSRDGGARWAKSSEPAFKSGRFFRTVRETYMLPEASCAVNGNFDDMGRASATHPPGVWFPEETEEFCICSKKHDLTLTILHLPKSFRWLGPAEPVEPDTFDRFMSGGR